MRISSRPLIGALLCVGFIATCMPATRASAAPSDLDGAWGQGGIVTLDGTWLAEGKLQFGRNLVLSYRKAGAPPTSEVVGQVVRLDPSGRIDGSFGSGGAPQPNLDVMADGRVVTLGSTGGPPGGYCPSVWIDRFLSDAQPDASFGTSGHFNLGAVGCPNGQFVVNPWGEGFFTASTYGLLGSYVNYYIQWVDGAGTTKQTFGLEETRQGLPGQFVRVARWVYSGALAADGKRRVWAAAPATWADERFAIVRFLDRQLDATFGVEGRAVAPVPAVVRMERIALDNLGGVIATGIAEVDGLRQLFLVRFIDRGLVDVNFGRAGVADVALAAPGEEVAEIRVAVQADGRIVVAATVQHATDTSPKYPRIAIARLLPDGSPDTRFAGGGVANLWTHWGTSVQFVALRPSGQIIVGGNSITAYPDGNPAYVPVVFQLEGGELAAAKPLRERRAVEYFYSGYGHYFTTADADETASLDMAAGAGWQRTGQSFGVWDAASAGLVPVCRFWSDQSFAPKSSHFYTPYADECAIVKTNPTWLFERNAFYARLSEGTPGARTCPTTTQPLFRAYNNGQGGAPNHRYTTDPAVLDAMIAQGWVMEGEAITRVFACVPAQ